MMAFTRKELYDLVWSKPIKTIAAEFGLEPVHFANVCDEHDIPVRLLDTGRSSSSASPPISLH